MTELLEIVTSWRSLLLVLLVFGFAPGFCLRLIVLAYPRNDPRRAELVAELYGVPRIQRPLWVVEQLEVALFEGLTHRISATLHRFSSRGRPRRLKAGSGLMYSSVLFALLGWVLSGVAMFSNVPSKGSLWVVVSGAIAIAGAVLVVQGVLGLWRSRQHMPRRPNSEE